MAEARLRRQVADLEAELNSVKDAKVGADERILELEGSVVALEERVDSLTRELEGAMEEADRQGRVGREEVEKHEELRRLQEQLIVSLQAQLRGMEPKGRAGGDGARGPGRAETGAPRSGASIDGVTGDGSGGTGSDDVEEGETPTDGEEATIAARVTRRSMKLPALPTFDGNDKDEGAYKRWVAKLGKHAELQNWSEREKLLQLELHLTGKAERVYEVLAPGDRKTFAGAVEALGKRIQPAKREALASAQLLRRRQRMGESVDDYVREFEKLFEESYGHRADVDTAFKAVLKRDIFVQGLLLKWQEKVLPTTKTFPDALHLARTAEDQEKQLGLIHQRSYPPKRDSASASCKDSPARQSKGEGEPSQEQPQQQQKQPAQVGRYNKIRCYKCQGLGHTARFCPLRTSPGESKGGTGGAPSGSSSAVTVTSKENPRDQCQRLQQEWMGAEFHRLAEVYTAGSAVDTVKGALGPLWYANVEMAGSPVRAMVDTGSSATILAFSLFQKIGPKAGISWSTLRKPEITLTDYSRRPIPIFAEVDLEISHKGKKMTAPVYLRSDQGQGGEPCLLGTNVLVSLGLVFPGLGVECQEESAVGRGKVRLIRAERIPSRCGVMVEAMVEGLRSCEGIAVIEPLRENTGVSLEPMVVEPDQSGKVSFVVSNPSLEVVHLDAGQDLGSVYQCEEYVGQMVSEVVAEVGCVGVNEVKAVDESGRSERLEAMLGELGSDSLRDLVLGAHDVFAVDEGERGEVRDCCHEVNTGDSPPIRQAARRVPFALKEKMSKLVGEMLSGGEVQESCSPWASPVVLVKKKSGDLRFCVDYRRLNAVTRKDVFPLPRIDDLLDQLGGKRVFSTLDAKSGYWQIRMAPSSVKKTAFVTPEGLYEFTVMPFGLCNAPATFQRLMQKVLSGLGAFCSVFIDDILIFSESEAEHLDHLAQVFERLRRFGLKLHPGKCRFARPSVRYLGHVISARGIEPDTDNVKAVQEFPVPTAVRGVRQFLGMASYYRRFMPGFAKTAGPLHALTREDVPFLWSMACQEAFLKLKDLLVSPPVLAYPNFDRGFVMHTDASIKGLGAVLEQEQEDGRSHPIAYASRSLSKAEKNYGVTELEALGVVWGAKHFRAYLYGHRCLVYTDHSPLKSMLTSQHPSGKLARWSQLLSEFELEIRYRPGRVNANADALSRAPVGGADPSDDGTEVQVAQVGTIEENLPQPGDEVKRLQESDEEVRLVLRYVRDGVVPEDLKVQKRVLAERDRFVLMDGLLFYVDPARKDRARLVVPVGLRRELMEEVHGGGFAGHFAVKGMYGKLSKRYWWRGMYSDIHKWYKECLTCAAYGGGGRRSKPPLKSIPVGGPFERLGVDILELPLTLLGNRYVLVCLDYLTKWVEAYPLQDQTSETIARVLVDMIICRHGVPRELLSDRGANFLSGIMQDVCSLTGMRKINTTAYHPQTDGLVENFNRTLRAMLAKHSHRFGVQWDVHLQQLLFAYRTKPHESTGESPFFLVYGRDARLPTESVLSTPPSPYLVDSNDYQVELARGLASAWEIARSEIGKAQQKQKTQYDKRAKEVVYKEGGRVMVFMPKVATAKDRKLALPYHGPYRVLEVLPNCLRVRLVDRPNEEPILISKDRVVQCSEELRNTSWAGKRKRVTRARGAKTKYNLRDQ